ncbi:MAG: hypothetical protein ACXV2G_05340 [Actinomycetes bacterium]
MSDPRLPQRPTGDDRVRDTLTALRADVDGVPLAASTDVRRRGQARSRHQAVVALAAAAVLVTAGVGAALDLTGEDSSAPVARTPTVLHTATPSPANVAPLVTDVPAGALVRLDDLGVVGMQKTSGSQGVETLNPCLLGSGDLVSSGAAVFGPGGDIYASHTVVTQSKETGAINQLAGYAADMDACGARIAQQGQDPTVTVSPLDLTAPQQEALGDGAWAFRVRTKYAGTAQSAPTTIVAYAVGVRARNASGLLAFSTKGFTAEQAVTAAAAARDRMVAVYGG